MRLKRNVVGNKYQVSPKKSDYNKRMRTKETQKKRDRKENLVIQNVKLEEIMDETGEVPNNTTIQISFEGILINLSVAAAIRLNTQLTKILK